MANSEELLRPVLDEMTEITARSISAGGLTWVYPANGSGIQFGWPHPKTCLVSARKSRAVDGPLVPAPCLVPHSNSSSPKTATRGTTSFTRSSRSGRSAR